MEEVLETYEKACDAERPLVCMDEQPVQWVKETRVPTSGTKEHGKRVGYEYERDGAASFLILAEPLSGVCQATARPQRTKADWAIEVAHLLDTRYADFACVTLVCDKLNAHSEGAFYEAVEVKRTRAYVKRTQFSYTPQRGGWLNVAELELSCLTSQGLSDLDLEYSVSLPTNSPELPDQPGLA